MTSVKAGNLKINEDFVNVRLIATLTVGTFTRKMIIISTLLNIDENKGETAIKQTKDINCLTCDYNSGFKTIKKHKSLNVAVNYHNNLIKNQSMKDCEDAEEIPNAC